MNTAKGAGWDELKFTELGEHCYCSGHAMPVNLRVINPVSPMY